MNYWLTVTSPRRPPAAVSPGRTSPRTVRTLYLWGRGSCGDYSDTERAPHPTEPALGPRDTAPLWTGPGGRQIWGEGQISRGYGGFCKWQVSVWDRHVHKLICGVGLLVQWNFYIKLPRDQQTGYYTQVVFICRLKNIGSIPLGACKMCFL